MRALAALAVVALVLGTAFAAADPVRPRAQVRVLHRTASRRAQDAQELGATEQSADWFNQ
jgi:hypothetical protein